MSPDGVFPKIEGIALDCLHPRTLAEFYRELLGLSYRAGDEPPGEGQPDRKGNDWLVLLNPAGPPLAFQQVKELSQSTWPDPTIPQQLHLDLSVPSAKELEHQHLRAVGLGAKLLADRSDDPEEKLRVYADPSGHPFCIFVVPESAGGSVQI